MKKNHLKPCLVLLCTFVWLILTAATPFKSGISLNCTEPLIDLASDIPNPKWPAGGGEESTEKETEAETETAEAVTETAAGQASETEPSEAATDLTVKIYGTKIYLNGKECQKEQIEEVIRSEYLSVTEVKLIDYYADKDTYEEVAGILAAEGLNPQEKAEE